MNSGFLNWVLSDGEVDDGARCDCSREKNGRKFDLVVIGGEKNGHSSIEFTDGELDLGRSAYWGLRHCYDETKLKLTWREEFLKILSHN